MISIKGRVGKIHLRKCDKRFYYKLEVLYNKYAPAFVGFMITLDNYFNLQNNLIHSFTYLCVPSILTLGHMYISRSVLQFCKLHRILVNYILFNVLYRAWQVIPFLPQWDRSTWHTVYTITFILGIMIFLYNYVADNKKDSFKDNK